MSEAEPILKIDGDGENEVMAWMREGFFWLTVENPWAGDSERGFGAEATIRLDQEGARQLRDFLNQHIEVKP